MKYLLLLLPSLAFANFVSEGGSVTYAEKEYCEKYEGVKCYEIPKEAPETKTLKDVLVDNLEKPILVESAPVMVRNPDNGLDEPRCQAPKTLNTVKSICEEITGYAKKLEKIFVTDPIKVADKIKKDSEAGAKQSLCEEFKTLLKGSAIDAKSKPEDVMEVTRRLLGYVKSCQL